MSVQNQPKNTEMAEDREKPSRTTLEKELVDLRQSLKRTNSALGRAAIQAEIDRIEAKLEGQQ